MFYWPWHLSNNSTGPYNVNNISKANPTRNNDYNWWNRNYPLHQGTSYWWNEPIYGYYMERYTNRCIMKCKYDLLFLDLEK